MITASGDTGGWKEPIAVTQGWPTQEQVDRLAREWFGKGPAVSSGGGVWYVGRGVIRAEGFEVEG